MVRLCVVGLAVALVVGPASAAPRRPAAKLRPAAAQAAPGKGEKPAPFSTSSGPNAPAKVPGSPPPDDPAARRAWFKRELDAIFEAPALRGAKLGVAISEFETGQILYARNHKAPLNAAANAKIITSAAALSRLGPEYRWRTVVYGPTQRGGRWLGPGGLLAGDLYIRGGGDPTLQAEALGELAADLAAQGLTRVRGSLVVDASFFDDPNQQGRDPRREGVGFRPPSSAASLEGNTVAVTVIPAAEAGRPARITVNPTSPYFTIAGRIVTAGMEGPAVPMVDTEADANQTRVVVGGRIRVGERPRVFYRRVHHPEWFLGHTFLEVLRKRGIAVEQPLRLGVVPKQGYRTLTAHESPALAEVAHDLNKRSSSFAAEQVLRTLGAENVGAPGTWDKGLESIAQYLESLGIARNTYRLTNGAGLYDSNRFSAEQIVTVLRATLNDFRIASEFMSSLAVAGVDGTLGPRLAGTSAERFVRAKTGTLGNVAALSGVVGSPGQGALLFSVLFNDVVDPLPPRQSAEAVALTLVQYLDPSANVATGSPRDSRP